MNDKINPEEIERLLAKIKVYSNELTFREEDLSKKLEDLQNIYNSDSSTNIKEINMDLEKKFIKINNKLFYDYSQLIDIVNNRKLTMARTNQLFNDINTDIEKR